MDKERRLLSPQEVADILGIARSTVWRWIRNGKLKCFKLSARNYRVPVEAIDELLLKEDTYEEEA